MHIQPIINQIASHAKKSQDPTVNLKIKSIFSQYEESLFEVKITASGAFITQTTATTSQQTVQEISKSRIETPQVPRKRGRSTTENMLIEFKKRNRLTTDIVTLMLLMKHWKCNFITCYNYQQSGEYYVVGNGVHYWILRHILGSWAKMISAGQADREHMLSDLLQDLRPARSPRVKDKAPAQLMSQPFGYPYMMPPPAAMYANHYN